jgi:hypothetical protein
MFERITLDHPNFPVNTIDLGLLAECLVFYGKTRLIVDQQYFQSLVRACGPYELIDLQSSRTLEIEYVENLTGVLTVPKQGMLTYDVGLIGSQSLKYLQVARKLFDDLAGPSGRGASRMFNKFERLVRRSDYSKDMLNEARIEWLDNTYTTEAARVLLTKNVPEYSLPVPLEFRVYHDSLGYRVHTNINFIEANALYSERFNGAKIDPAYILIHIANTRRDLILSSKFGSEMALAPEQTLIAACKVSGLLSSLDGNLKSAELFQDEVIDGLPSIRNAVKNGQKSIADVIRLVEKAEKFKDWLRKQNDGVDLRKAYLTEVTHIDWAEKLPPKALRWLIFAGASAVTGFVLDPLTGALAGTALSAIDSFLIDHLVKGWKPNQFVDGPLKNFLRSGI